MIGSLAFALLATTSGPAVPAGPSAVAKLSTDELAHHEVLRIDRDFGMEHWEIALDAWLTRAAAGHIADVRLWWVDTSKDDRRKPFSRHLSRFVRVDHARADDGSLQVKLAGDDKEYRFAVGIDPAGAPFVFADVELDDGATVAGCRCESGRLLARRVLGIPIGIAQLRVRCRDADGRSHEGRVPHRVAEGTARYTPE